MVLPKPSQMFEKSGLKMTTGILPSLINVVVPLGVSRTGLSHGVQVIWLFVLVSRHYCLKLSGQSVYVNCKGRMYAIPTEGNMRQSG